MIRAVIFDLGHTLWDILPDDAGALDAAYRDVHATLVARVGAGIPEPRAFRDAVAAALREDADTYFMAGHILEQPPTHIWVERGCLALDLHLDESLLREITIPLFATEIDRLAVMPGTVKAVKGLKRDGLALGCVTNTLTDQATIELMIEKYGFGGLFDTVIVSTEQGYRKPHPSLFEAAARNLQVTHTEALFVGDSPYHDIAGAKAVGMYAAQTRQYATRPLVDGIPEPDAVIDHLSELPEVVRRLSKTR